MSPKILPSPWLTMPIFFGLFFGGGYLGGQLSSVLAPDSGLAELVSFLTLPAAFVIGMVAWAGGAVLGAVRRIVQRSTASVKETVLNTAVPPGSFAFVPVALVTGLAAGAVVGAVSQRLGFGWVFCLYGGIGFSYGTVCWMLARTGYLPFPRD